MLHRQLASLRKDYPHVPVNIPNYSLHQTNTTASKGGSALYILNSLKFAEWKDLNTQIYRELETTFVEMDQNKTKNIICRHPNSNIEDYHLKILDKISKKYKTLMLMVNF